MLVVVVVSVSIPSPSPSLVASIKVPHSETDYDEEFFRQHEQNAPIYPVMVNLMGSSVVSSGLTGSAESSSASPSAFSTLDVGCGHGLLVEAWRKAGIRDSYGLEGSSSAQPLWPVEYTDEYYQIVDLTKNESKVKVPKTDIVTTFEVAEHLPQASATHLVQLLVLHKPSFVFFGAATVFQDRGQNPSHVNENTFAYWIDKFTLEGYIPDMDATARIRLMLLQNPVFRQHIARAWWYPKNLWVFVPHSASKQMELDSKLLKYGDPAVATTTVNMLDPKYVKLMNQNDLGEIWRRDWTEFGTLFYQEQSKARQRLEANNNAGGEL